MDRNRIYVATDEYDDHFSDYPNPRAYRYDGPDEGWVHFDLVTGDIIANIVPEDVVAEDTERNEIAPLARRL